MKENPSIEGNPLKTSDKLIASLNGLNAQLLNEVSILEGKINQMLGLDEQKDCGKDLLEQDNFVGAVEASIMLLSKNLSRLADVNSRLDKFI